MSSGDRQLVVYVCDAQLLSRLDGHRSHHSRLAAAEEFYACVRHAGVVDAADEAEQPTGSAKRERETKKERGATKEGEGGRDREKERGMTEYREGKNKEKQW